MNTAVLGVVIVAYNSGAEIIDCLESLLAGAASANVDLRIVVVDNASTDETVCGLIQWSTGEVPYIAPETLPIPAEKVQKPVSLVEICVDSSDVQSGDVHLIRSSDNLGFAGGVNIGLGFLSQFEDVGHFWVLNPDSVVPATSLAALAEHLAQTPNFALMGGRVCYMDNPDRIQIDGGTVNSRTGVTGNLNLGQSAKTTPAPDPRQIDFIMGASMVVSRTFYERVGPMREDYFLYYEEVDWAMRRGDMPLVYCDGLVVYHHAGSSIGSPGWGRRASPFSLYFKHRGRLRFLKRFHPASIPTGIAYSFAYAARLLIQDRSASASWAVLCGSLGLKAPKKVRAKLSDSAAKLAFGSRRR